MFVGDWKTDLDPSESANIYIEFTDDLAGGVTIASVDEFEFVSVKTVSGATPDTNPATGGAPQVVTRQDPAIGVRTWVVQNVTGAAGNKYRGRALVTLSDGQTLARYGHIWCRSPS